MSRSFLVVIPLAALAFGCASGNSAPARNVAAPTAPPVAVTNVTSGLPQAAATAQAEADDDCLDPSDLCFWSQGIVDHAAERERAEQGAQARARAASEQSKAAKRLREAKR